MASFATNTSISRPRPKKLTNSVDVGGFSFDIRHGLMIPSEETPDEIIAPTSFEQAS